jgi:two-component system, OmpR family, sensor kinase
MLQRLSSIRSQLLLAFLAVLVLLLVGLGVLQFFTLRNFLVSSTARSLHEAARSELEILGPCFVRSGRDLQRNASSLAQLLGSHEVGVKIVSPSGETLADHGIGAPGAARRLHIRAATIKALIASARTGPTRTRQARRQCLQPPSNDADTPRAHASATRTPLAVTDGGFIYVSMPLGPPGTPVGYALLARSSSEVSSTLDEIRNVYSLGALAAFLLAALVTLPLIQRALLPLRKMARTAEAISAGDLRTRTAVENSHDEIRLLGEAFNRMVDSLQTALATARHSEDQMRRFLADASHELRTPITAVRGNSEILLRQGPKGQEDAEEALRAIYDESLRLSGLVDNLLALTRADSGATSSPRAVPMVSFVSDFIDRYRDVWPAREIRAHFEDLDGASAEVDPDALTRILSNLVDNSAKYSKDGAPIGISGEAGPDTVSLAVSDQGPGLQPGEVDRIFQRFYRGPGARLRDSSGSGLGLAIVQALVRQNAGNIRFESDPDSGTVVSVTFPRALREESKPVSAAPRGPSSR